MAETTFSCLVRFQTEDGTEYYGDAVPTTDGQFVSARVIEGDVFGSCKVTERVEKIHKLLAPLSHKTTHTIRGIGINYKGAPEQTGIEPPKLPMLFYKPVTSFANPFDDISIAPNPQDEDMVGLDAEVELVVIIGKEARDVEAKDAMSYIFGYTLGNDLTHIGLAIKGAGKGAWGKHGDGWTPLGPCIIPSRLIDDPLNLDLWTKINGETVQDGNTKDMIWQIPELISQLSRGTTLLPGDVILTGTPLGVRSSRKPPVFLQDGDVIEMWLEKVGIIRGTCRS